MEEQQRIVSGRENDEDSVISSAPSSPPMPLPPPLHNNGNSRLLGNFPDINFLPDGGSAGPGAPGASAGAAQETKVIYHIDDETTPYLVKIPMPSASVTLRDFKIVLNKQNLQNYKYFFKSMDADFGYTYTTRLCGI